MVQGSWAGDLIPVYLFFSLLFSALLFIPVSASVAWDGVGCFTLLASIPFLFFHYLSCSYIALPLSFFIFFLLFSVLFFIPYEHVNSLGCGRRFRSLSFAPFIFLLRSSHLFLLLLSFLGIDACRPYRVDTYKRQKKDEKERQVRKVKKKSGSRHIG